MLVVTLMAALLGMQEAPPADPIPPPRIWTGSQVVWKKLPRPDRGLQAQNLPRDVLYIANLDCRIMERGRLADCLVMSEQANTVNFGQAAIRGARDARIELSPAPGVQPGDRLVFAVALTMRE